MATTAPKRWISEASLAESHATSSDHWPLPLTLQRRLAVAPTPRARGKARQKPIGWKVEELTYNDEIRERLGMEQPVDIAEIKKTAFHIYTDGSYTGYRHLHARSRHTKKENITSDILRGKQGGLQSSSRKACHRHRESTLIMEWDA